MLILLLIGGFYRKGFSVTGKYKQLIMILRPLIIFVLSAFSHSGLAQYNNSVYFSDTCISPADSQQLYLRFGNATFLSNKEFFNPYQPGYTLTGYHLRPMLEYYPGPYTRLTAGVHLLKYSGVGRYTQTIPVFSIHHRFSPGLDLVAGTLYGSLNHGLIEPLFAFERVFTHYNESGLQLLIDQGFLEADIWLNWEKFIFAGDPFREEFTAGISSRVLTRHGGSSFRAELPLQLLLVHRGGQIDDSGERMQNMVNFAGGVHLNWDISNSFFKSVGLRAYLAGFRDFSSELRYHYDKGWGIYPNIIVRTRWVEGGIGYWRGNKFVAPRGEPVFQSVSRVDPEIADDHRELITSKIIFNHKLTTGINLGLRFEIYHDPVAGNFDHSGGLHILIDKRFFIVKLKRR
jgi:hypothetical protein